MNRNTSSEELPPLNLTSPLPTGPQQELQLFMMAPLSDGLRTENARDG